MSTNKNDLVKSILDFENNNVEGLEIELSDIIEKYWYQRSNWKMGDLSTWYTEDEDGAEIIEEMRRMTEWYNDGKPTGIESDEQWNALQIEEYGEILDKIGVIG